MAVIAVYSLKGGVGKSTLATTLSWCAASLSARRTLLWDLDAQAASSWLLGDGRTDPFDARAVFSRETEPLEHVRSTRIDNLSLLPADPSLRALDLFFHSLDKRKRLAKLAGRLLRSFDRIVLDCPPGLSAMTDQILRAAALVVVPVIPSPLARRAFEEVAAHLRKGRAGVRMLPVFNMVDRRRVLHREALAGQPHWPAVPMASALETLSSRVPLAGRFPASSAAGGEIERMWRMIETALAA